MKFSSSCPSRRAAKLGTHHSQYSLLRKALLHYIKFILFLLLATLFILNSGGFTLNDSHFGSLRHSAFHYQTRHPSSALPSKQDIVYINHEQNRANIATGSAGAEIPHAGHGQLSLRSSHRPLTQIVAMVEENTIMQVPGHGQSEESDGLALFSSMDVKNLASHEDNMLMDASLKKDIDDNENPLHRPIKADAISLRSVDDEMKASMSVTKMSAIAIKKGEEVQITPSKLRPEVNEEKLESTELVTNNVPSKEDTARDAQGHSKLPSHINMSAPFWLIPKISDWDQQRQAYLSQNPIYGSDVNESILLISSSRPNACDNPHGDHSLLKFMKNKIDYCRLHDIEIYYNMVQMDENMVDYWSKLPLLRTLMISHPEIKWFWWMDSDAMFTDMTFELPMAKYKDYNLVIHGWEHQLFVTKSWIGLNAGIFLLRNCQWSLDLIDSWVSMGANGKIREEAGKVLAETLSDRALYEADDQSVLVYLLITQKKTWRSKVFLETSYCLHGYWDFLVDKYEELMESSRPGYGDDRWPFITHFVGCKPCEKEGHYAQDRCLKQMERAFNFADNQVLQQYGFKHVSLGSSNVESI